MNKNPRGHEYEYRFLRPSEIKFDRSYQRDLDNTRVMKIANEFNGDIFNSPKVSYRDNQYFCFDGQQSTAAWNAYHHNNDTPVECKVFYNMTWEDELEAFIQQCGFSKAVAASMKLRAKYNRGDHDVVNMSDIVNVQGWVLDFLNAKSKSKNKISAINTLYKCYTTLGMEAFTDMMQVIREAWGDDPDAVQNQILSAFRKFYKAYYGHFSHDDMVSSMRQTTPNKIIQDGRKYTARPNYTYALLQAYNTGRRKNRLDYKALDKKTATEAATSESGK